MAHALSSDSTSYRLAVTFPTLDSVFTPTFDTDISEGWGAENSDDGDEVGVLGIGMLLPGVRSRDLT